MHKTLTSGDPFYLSILYTLKLNTMEMNERHTAYAHWLLLTRFGIYPDFYSVTARCATIFMAGLREPRWAESAAWHTDHDSEPPGSKWTDKVESLCLWAAGQNQPFFYGVETTWASSPKVVFHVSGKEYTGRNSRACSSGPIGIILSRGLAFKSSLIWYELVTPD